MNILVTIDGREAIPLQAIPFLTGSKPFTNEPVLAPSLIMLAARTACEGILPPTPPLNLYLISEKGRVEQVKKEYLDCTAPESEFQPEDDAPLRESFKRLPSGLFAFRDELEKFLVWINPLDDLGEFLDTLTPGCMDAERRWMFDPQLPKNIAEFLAAEIAILASAAHAAETQKTATDAISQAVTWQEQCRAIADELHAKDVKAGAYSSMEDISQRVAKIADERGIEGVRGKLTANNIKREALQGGRWIRKEPPK